MKKTLSCDTLKADIKNNSIKRCYIFNGEEEYLKSLYVKKLYEAFCKNGIKDLSYFEYEGKKNIDLEGLVDKADAPPMFGNNKMLIIKNLYLFSGESNENSANKSSNIFIDYIKNIPEYLCIIFFNSNDFKFTKNSKIYKEIKKCYGEASLIEFSAMSTEYLCSWINEFFKGKKAIKNDAVQYLIEIKDSKMSEIIMEANKLLSYCSDKDYISKSDVENLCSKSIEYQIFILTDMIGQKNASGALKILSNMKSKKVAAPYIVSMLNWQFKNLLQIGSMVKMGCNSSEIVSKLGVKEYTVTKSMKLIRNFEELMLINAIRDCAECDLNMKRSSIEPFLMIESIIVKYASKNL